MKIRKIIITVILFLLSGLLFIVGSISYESGVSYGEYNAEEIRASKIKNVSAVVSSKFANVQVVLNKAYPVIVSGSGRVRAGTMINISSEVQGLLNSPISLKKGTSFKKGDLIFKIRDTDAKLSLAARKSNYLSQWTSVLPDLATDHSKQYDKWYNFFNSITVDQPLEEFPNFTTSKEKNFIISRKLLAEYLNIKSDEYRLTKYFQVAPFSGSIVEAYIDQGAIVNPGSPVIQIIRDDELEIEIPLAVKYMQKIKIGSSVTLIENENEFMGKVVRVGNFINANTQSVPVYIKPINKLPLYYGMYVKAKLELNALELVCKIPRTAIFGENKIYTVDMDSTIHSTKINIRSSDERNYYVDNLKDSIIYLPQPIVNSKESLKITPIFN